MIRGILALAILAAAGVAAVRVFGFMKVGPDDGHDQIPTYKVQPIPFEVRLSSMGALEAASNRQISSRQSGKITKVLPEGTLVEQDDPVVWMDTTDDEDELKTEEVDLALAKNDLAQAEEDYRLLLAQQDLENASLRAKVDFQQRKLEDADKQYKNTQEMVERSLAAPSDLEDRKLEQLQSKLALEEAKIALDKAEKTRQSQILISQTKIDGARVLVEKHEQDVAESKRDIENATLRAPGRGHISYIPIRMGGNLMKVSEGTDVYERTPLIQIPDSSTMLAKIPINEVDITKVQTGQLAEVRVQAFATKVYKAEVAKKSIVPVSDSSLRRFLFGGTDSSVREFEVTVKLLDDDPDLRQGMTASVDLIVEKGADRLGVPQVAVFQDGANNIVFKRKSPGFEVSEVQLGLSNENYVEILKGVAPGDVLLLRNPTKQIERVGALDEVVAPPAR